MYHTTMINVKTHLETSSRIPSTSAKCLKVPDTLSANSMGVLLAAKADCSTFCPCSSVPIV